MNKVSRTRTQRQVQDGEVEHQRQLVGNVDYDSRQDPSAIFKLTRGRRKTRQSVKAAAKMRLSAIAIL